MFGKKKIKTPISKYYGYRSNKETGIKWHEKYGSVSDWIGVAISLFVGVVTLYLFSQTKTAANAAVQSAAAADSTFREQRKNDSLARKRDSVNDINNGAAEAAKRYRDSVQFVTNLLNERKRFQLDSISNAQRFIAESNTLKTQLDALKETRRLFQLENRPFVNIVSLEIDTSFKDNQIKASWTFYNTGKLPATMEYVYSHLGFGPDSAHIKYIPTGQPSYPNGNIGGGITLPYFGYAPISDDVPRLKNSVQKGTTNIYLSGEFRYYSSVLDKVYRTRFMIEVNYSTFTMMRFLVNKEF